MENYGYDDGDWQLGRPLSGFAPTIITAYNVDLTGSLIGTWLLTLFSYFFLPPIYWFALVFFLIMLARGRHESKKAALFLTLPVLALFLFNQFYVKTYLVEDVWSPYQLLSLLKGREDQYDIGVNNTGYMTLYNTTPEFLKRHPEVKKGLPYTSYDSPFHFIKNNAEVLIVGAGAGNDASAALRNGAAQVDAVEIDPGIYRLGKRYHADQPYENPKVNVILNDARNYLRTTEKTYNAVIFGLLDSHTGPSGYSNLRVDNYVYTRQAFEQARKLLKPDGVLVLKFEVRDPWGWIGERFYRTLTDVFGHSPVVWHSDEQGVILQGSVYVVSKDPDLASRVTDPEFNAFIADNPPPFSLDLATAPESATDDWPYPYSRDRAIPRTYIIISVILVLLTAIRLRGNLAIRSQKSWHMMALGAGFMLMETQLINRLCLYFGTTWIVSAIAITTVLAVLVLANFYINKFGLASRKIPYALLVISLIVNYVISWEHLPWSPLAIGTALTLLFSFTIAMSGLIFTSAFREAERKSSALGANIMGAVIGGVAQNLSFILGLKALLLCAAAVYIVAFLLDKSKMRAIV